MANLTILLGGFMAFVGWLTIGAEIFFSGNRGPLWYNITGGILFLILPLILVIYLEKTDSGGPTNPGPNAGWPGHYDDY